MTLSLARVRPDLRVPGEVGRGHGPRVVARRQSQTDGLVLGLVEGDPGKLEAFLRLAVLVDGDTRVAATTGRLGVVDAEAEGRRGPRVRLHVPHRDADRPAHVDVDVAGVLGFDVAGPVDRPVLDDVRSRRRDRKRGRVGLPRTPVEPVVRGGGAGSRVACLQGDRLGRVAPTR